MPFVYNNFVGLWRRSIYVSLLILVLINDFMKFLIFRKNDDIV